MSIVNLILPRKRWYPLLVFVAALGASDSLHAQTQDTQAPRIVHEPCPSFELAKPFSIVAQFFDASDLFEPAVLYRDPSGSWQRLPLERRDMQTFAATIPAEELGEKLEYFIEVFDELGNGPALLGSSDTPVALFTSTAVTPCDQVPTGMSAPLVLQKASSDDQHAKEQPQAVTPLQGSLNKTTTQDPCDASDAVHCKSWFPAAMAIGAIVFAGVVGYSVYRVTSKDGDESAPPRINIEVTGVAPTAGLRLQW